MSASTAEDLAVVMQVERDDEDRKRARTAQAATVIDELASQMSSSGRPATLELEYIGSLMTLLHIGLLCQALSACVLFVLEGVTVEVARAWVVWGCLVGGGLIGAFCFCVVYARLERYWGRGRTLLRQVKIQHPGAHAAILATLHWVALAFLFSLVWGVLVCDLKSSLQDAALSLFEAGTGKHAAIGEYIQAMGPVLFTLHCGVFTHVRIQWKTYQDSAGAKEP